MRLESEYGRCDECVKSLLHRIKTAVVFLAVFNMHLEKTIL